MELAGWLYDSLLQKFPFIDILSCKRGHTDYPQCREDSTSPEPDSSVLPLSVITGLLEYLIRLLLVTVKGTFGLFIGFHIYQNTFDINAIGA